LDFLKNWIFDNKLVILDNGIERKYEEISKIAKSKKWKMIVIRIVASKRLIVKRIKIKDKKRLKEHPEDLKRCFKEYNDFNKRVKSDFVFKSNSDLRRLFMKLDRRL
jgi:hypothetical protein